MAVQRIFLSLCGLVFIINLSRIVFAPLLEPLGTEFGVGNDTLGLIVSSVWIGSAIPRIPIAYLLTRVRQEQVVLWSGIGLAVISLVTASAQTVFVFGLCAFLMGTMSGAYFAAGIPLLSELYPSNTGRVFGIHGTASQLAAVVAPAIVVAFLLLGPWRLVFVAISVATSIITAIFWHIAKDRETDRTYTISDRNFTKAIRSDYPTILTGLALLGITGFVWNGVFNFYPSYMIAEKGISPTVAPFLLTIVFAAGVPAFWISGTLSDRLPTIPYILSIIVSFVVCLYALILSNGLVAVVMTTVAIGYVIHSIFPAMDVFVIESISAENRSSIYGVYSGFVLLIESLGSFVVGYATEAGHTYATVFVTFSVVLIAMTISMILLYGIGKLPDTRSAHG